METVKVKMETVKVKPEYKKIYEKLFAFLEQVNLSNNSIVFTIKARQGRIIGISGGYDEPYNED